MKVVVTALAALLFAIAAHAADVAGTWQLTVETTAGTGTPTLVLAQDGATLTGTYTGRFGEMPITGTTNGDTIEFSFTATGPMGGTATVKYTGTVAGDTMSGSMTMGDRAGGTFTGQRR